MSRVPALARPVSRMLAMLTALLVLLPTAASAFVEVDPYSSYQPATKCSPKAKPGTLELSRWLQRRYAGTGSLGISRECGVSGASEHKEGRALDWAVDHGSQRDRTYVAGFLHRILATDRRGNTHALARRMGIMYLIWNDRIYSAYRQFEPRAYLSPSCASRRSCSESLRHRDHVHISLSRAGGRGDTSWYHRGEPDPEPEPEPEPEPPVNPEPTDDMLDLTVKPYATVAVPMDGSTRTTGFRLAVGRTYKVTVAGLYHYGNRPDQVADASCVWSRAEDAWVRDAGSGGPGTLNLQVDGEAPLRDACTRRHVYTTTVTPSRTRPMRLRVATRRDAVAGRLVAVVSRPSTDVRAALPEHPQLAPPPERSPAARRGFGLLAETVSVPADERFVSTAQQLRKGVAYRVSVSGTVSLGRSVQADAQCLAPAGTWYRRASLDRRLPGADHGNLFLDGRPFESTGGLGAGSRGCIDHRYVADLTAVRTGRLRLGIWDPLTRTDNDGALTVTVQRLSPLPTPGRADRARPDGSFAWTRPRDWVEVSSASRGGTVSRMRLRAGEEVQVTVRGLHVSPGGAGVAADAACVRVDGTWRATDPRLATGQDPMQLWVDGRAAPWRALGRTAGCSEEHAYSTTYVVRRDGPLRLAVLDLDHRDNRGALEVTLLRADRPPRRA